MVQEALFEKRERLPQGKGRWSRCRAFRSFIGRGRTHSRMLRLCHGRIVEQAYTSVRLYPHQSGANDSAKQPNLPAAAAFGREAGGAMLAITGATRRPGR